MFETIVVGYLCRTVERVATAITIDKEVHKMGHELLWGDWERDQRVRTAQREREQDRLARLASDAEGVQPESTGKQRVFHGIGLAGLLTAVAKQVLSRSMAQEPIVEGKGRGA